MGTVGDQVKGFEVGANDYIVKPFSIEELENRIDAILRKNKEIPKTISTFEISGLKIDFEKKILLKSNSVFELSEIEIKILKLLVSEKNKIFSREEIINFVWGFNSFNHLDSRIVDVYVSKLRSKLENEPKNPIYLQTIRGFGYRFVCEKN